MIHIEQGVSREEYYSYPRWCVDFTKDDKQYRIVCEDWNCEVTSFTVCTITSLSENLEYRAEVSDANSQPLNLYDHFPIRTRIDSLLQDMTQFPEYPPTALTQKERKELQRRLTVTSEEAAYLATYMPILDLVAIIWEYVGPACSLYGRHSIQLPSLAPNASGYEPLPLSLLSLSSFHTTADICPNTDSILWVENQTVLLRNYGRNGKYVLHFCYHDHICSYFLIEYDLYGIPLRQTIPRNGEKNDELFVWACSAGREESLTNTLWSFLRWQDFGWLDIQPSSSVFPHLRPTYHTRKNIAALGDILKDLAGLSITPSKVILQFLHPCLDFPWYFQRELEMLQNRNHQ